MLIKLKHLYLNSYFLFLTLMLLPLVMLNCSKPQDPEYVEEISSWHSERVERLRKETGWLNLVGLFWLKEGENKFGSAKTNDIKFPQGSPEFIGSFYLTDTVVTVKIAEGIEITSDSETVSEKQMIDDQSGSPTTLELGSLRWYIIKRGDKFGVRLRDLNAAALIDFKGIERFPVDEKWKIEAGFHPYNPVRKISIPTVLGTREEETAAGYLEFNIEGNSYRLEALESGKQLFLIFADETSGEETYGAGRFLYINKPDSGKKAVIDFNKSYNPPCAFSRFATCPLPPEENYLRIRIEAGEKNYGEEH